MSADTPAALARELKVSEETVCALEQMLDAGLAAVFVAHYRKAATGGLEEVAVRRAYASIRRRRDLGRRRDELRALASAAGATSDELLERVAAEEDDTVLEDLAAPFRPARRTAASVARERGLGPLAEYILRGPAEGPDLAAKAAEFVRHDHEVHTPEDALAGAEHILADRVSMDAPVRAAVRRCVRERGVLHAAQAKKASKGAGEFRGYFNFSEPINHLPPHRILAINRGERSKALKVTIEVPREELLKEALALVVPALHRFHDFLETVVADALDRLVVPSIDRQVRHALTEEAEGHAIEVFAANLRSLLMVPPLRHKRIMALQPGFRSGCKVTVLDADGSLLAETIVYPFEPHKKREEARETLLGLIRRHHVQAVAIGNGTGCRDMEELVSEVIEAAELDLRYAIVNEAGAGVYADSDLARKEFPNLDAAVRATVSIGRRLRNPLEELVKIDPRAIGVGLYQHDVNQDKLRAELEATVQSVVCEVGVDANTASEPMLRYLPGVSADQARVLVERQDAAALTSREELADLPGWDDRTRLQTAGFLRIRGGANPLDSTRIHPERYAMAEKVLASLDHAVADLNDHEACRRIEKTLTGIALEPLAEQLQVPLLDLMDVVAALQHPRFDPRSRNHGPIFRRRIQRIEDLKPGMWVKGTVRNVVDFGAFVDIGLKEDGLIHISQFSKRYVRNPLKFLHVGDVVNARIVSIDAQRNRIALTLIPEEKKTPQPEPEAEAATESPSASPGPQPERRASRSPGDDGRKTGPGGRGRGRQREAASGGRGPSDGSRRGGGRGPSRGRRSDRPGREGKPRVHTFRDEPDKGPAPTDEQGRPRIRWAFYDSDLQANETAEDLEDQE